MKRILLAGFGGQGILFAGKFLAYVGLYSGQEVSWLPSYGPEMRGGTANCSVILSRERIGSPIVSTPDVLICMNLPSLDKFEGDIVPGGTLITDSSLVARSASRADIKSFGVPATKMANQEGMDKLANMILIGKMMRETSVCDMEQARQVLGKIIPEKKAALLDANLRAISLGYQYGEG